MIIVIPEIITNPNNITALIGQSIQLTCEAIGSDIVYQWMKNGIIVSGASSNMLRITNIMELDEGMYQCVVSNKGGQVNSIPSSVIVYGE